ncbi:MAG: response regulator [Caldilineaceae bacterium]
MSLSILVVDDEPGIRLLLTKALTAHGYTAFEAQDGHVGLQQFCTRQPDLILLDVNMPGRDGFSILQEIRRQDAVVGVVMISAARQSHIVRDALLNGADGYLHKPFNLQQLFQEIRRVGALVQTRRAPILCQPEPRFAFTPAWQAY